MILNKRLKLAYCVFIGCYGLSINPVLAAYHEPGRLGSPGSWKTAEFNRQWALGAISAEFAYARGYTGKDVAIGIIDQTILPHPELTGKLTRLGDDTYTFSYDKQDNISLGDHGTHVAGIAAARRDGAGMHGVAFDAEIISAKLGDHGDRNGREELIQSAARVINNSWGETPAVKKDAKGNNIWVPNGGLEYVALIPGDEINKIIKDKANLERDSEQPIPTGRKNSTAVTLRAARQGKLIVFSAGNTNNYNIPEASKLLPYAFPDVLNNLLIVTNLRNDDKLFTTSTSCGPTASYCVSAPGTTIYSTVGTLVSNTGGPVNRDAYNKGELSVSPGYGNKTGTSMSAPLVSGVAAVLMQRFPYMSADQISAVIKTTATDLGVPGIDNVFGWGRVNLREAINGPKMFITKEDIPQEYYVPGSYSEKQFVANIPGLGNVVEPGTTVERRCTSRECDFDSWSNDIAGHGGLTKTGAGTLELLGNNTYSGDTWVKQGALAINGSVASNVYIENSGTLAGGGTVNAFRALRGGSIAPGNGIGTLHVLHDAIFDRGSQYNVEVAGNGRSDKIEAQRALLNGGSVNVSLEHSKNLLSQNEAQSLLGNKYTILTTTDGVNGRFDNANPAYPFVNVTLDYQGKDVGLGITRTAARFDSLASTENEKAVARAVETLNATEPVTATAKRSPAVAPTAEAANTPLSAEDEAQAVNEDASLVAGHPVYESFLGFTSASELQQATRQLSGQIHADMAAAQLNESRYLRETATERLRQAEGQRTASDIKADDNGAWAKLLGSWGHASGNDNATGYQTSTYGVLMGLDGELFDDARLGVMTGYTRTSLDGGYQSDAHSDNYHLGLYGSKRFGALALRAGGAYTWHRIDTSRSVNYGVQSDREKASYNARTGQLFIESGYDWENDTVNLEPFANLAYTHYRNEGINEQGGAAALRGDKQSQSATASTLGLRADTQWQANSVVIALRGELGWQHQYGKLERKTQLMFKRTDAAFDVNSVPVSRNGAVLKAGVDVAVNNNAVLSLGYGGQLSSNHQDNSVNAALTWRF
ncbi:Extracellular serine protease precursor [Serratia entomophila]|nr:Extracellular serine protease precursor [Serratia entomophila]CAI1154815.1 Extracellular serine protease precursor [Serratia entomophila]CAI1156278.1 Extracellular serine protease precursor [Serratia entomophila]CAI1836031.1 Extracellular serine protease precursor [Serratia entomophila]CAI1979179.1 Extracellular serine protease precursor [Serratia entomophila]